MPKKYNVQSANRTEGYGPNNRQAIIKKVEITTNKHIDVQPHNMNIHESHMSNILRKNEGIWFSNFWAKVTYIALL